MWCQMKALGGAWETWKHQCPLLRRCFHASRKCLRRGKRVKEERPQSLQSGGPAVSAEMAWRCSAFPGGRSLKPVGTGPEEEALYMSSPYGTQKPDRQIPACYTFQEYLRTSNFVTASDSYCDVVFRLLESCIHVSILAKAVRLMVLCLPSLSLLNKQGSISPSLSNVISRNAEVSIWITCDRYYSS
ncbi:hypothetical protein VTN02DRAFT_319 [Thermoascus thermophilus]